MSENETTTNFIREEIDKDLASGRYKTVHTRFPPEPNGYLHIGHTKAIIIDYGTAEDYGGLYNLRFDDTNPTKEDVEYVDAIKDDIRWLGFDWEDREFYASDYFDQLYEYAIQLIKAGLAYVDDLSADEIREYRGTLTEPGKASPHRERSVEENLELFERMKNGEFAEGERVLRARIDMASPNMNMRDPIMYRILYARHHRTGDKWCIYPTYDWAHGQSDSIEGITHSLCSLEFENHRPLYEWFIEKLGIFPSRQIEFARLNMTYTMMSKRKLRRLVEEGLVEGWDDPRMPTIQALRRRGYRREAIHAFIERVGVAKTNSVIDYALLEHTVREDLDPIVPRVMAVLHPLKLVIENFPADQVEEFDVDYYRHDGDRHESRKVPLTREVYIERDDFMIDPPKKYFRLAPGQEVRLMNACLVTCTDYKVDEETGDVTEVTCTYDPESLGGQAPDGRRVKGTLHWVSAEKAIEVEVRIYDKLFTVEAPDDTEEGEDFTDFLNHDSLETITDAKLEPSLADAEPGSRFQFMRQGFYYIDPVATEKEGHPIYNQTVALRDSWAKIQAKQK